MTSSNTVEVLPSALARLDYSVDYGDVITGWFPSLASHAFLYRNADLIISFRCRSKIIIVRISSLVPSSASIRTPFSMPSGPQLFFLVIPCVTISSSSRSILVGFSSASMFPFLVMSICHYCSVLSWCICVHLILPAIGLHSSNRVFLWREWHIWSMFHLPWMVILLIIRLQGKLYSWPRLFFIITDHVYFST